MAKTTKLTATTPVGTFTRRTNRTAGSGRTYTHVVVTTKGVHHHIRVANYHGRIKNCREQIARYSKVLANAAAGMDPKLCAGEANPFHQECTARYIAEGLFQTWIEELTAEVAKLEAQGEPKECEGNGRAGVLGWAGSYDLALKRAAAESKHYAGVEIYPVDAPKGA